MREPTFSEGSIQKLFTLSNGSPIHLAVAEWRSGRGLRPPPLYLHLGVTRFGAREKR